MPSVAHGAIHVPPVRARAQLTQYLRQQDGPVPGSIHSLNPDRAAGKPPPRPPAGEAGGPTAQPIFPGQCRWRCHNRP